MAQAPMYIIGAKRTNSDAIRFVFMLPVATSDNVMDGNGALLEVTKYRELKTSGDTPLRGSLLEAFFETMVEGDGETQGKGPIPCGFAISGDKVQIVEYFSGELLIECRGELFTYRANIDMTNFSPDN